MVEKASKIVIRRAENSENSADDASISAEISCFDALSTFVEVTGINFKLLSKEVLGIMMRKRRADSVAGIRNALRGNGA
jgi:hypothetical protein